MKIVVASCVAPPETVVAGRVNYDICDYLSSNGYTVTLITPFPSRPLGKFNINIQKAREVININENFTHVKINSYRSPQFNFFKRIFESFSFGYKSIKYINTHIKGADLIYATPWPFIGQLMFVMLRKNKDIPLIMNIQDLYPESFFTKYNSIFFKYLFQPFLLIDKYISLNSTHLSVVSDSMKSIYVKTRGLSSSKVTVIENWQNEELFLKCEKTKSQILQEYNLNWIADKFVFMYLGNIGPVAGLEKVIEEFAKVDNKNSCMLIAGSGTAKDNCVEIAKSYSLTNVFFIDIPTGMDSVVELQSIADVFLLPIDPEASSSSIPSKLIAYMFSSKPILSSAKPNSTTGLVISENKCGLLINETSSWAHQMSKISLMDSRELQKMGQNGFNFGMSRYSKKNGLIKIKELFNNIINKN